MKKLSAIISGVLLGLFIFSFGIQIQDSSARAPTREWVEYVDWQMCPTCGNVTGCVNECDGEEVCCNSGVPEGITCLGGC